MTWIYEHKGLIFVLIVAIIFVFIAFSYGTYHPSPNSQLIQKMVDDKLKQEKENYDKTIAEKQELINQLDNQLKVSQNSVYKKQTEINKLKKLMSGINPPTTLQETRQRLIQLGYTPR